MNKLTELTKNAIWNAFGNIIYLGLQWVITIYVVRIGGYKDAGYLSLAMSITGTFQNIAHFGIRNYQISDTKEKYTDIDYIFARIITCLLALISCFIFVFLNSYSSIQMISIFCFMFFRLIESFIDVLHGIDQKNGRLDIAGKSFFIRGIFTFLIFCITYFIFKSLPIGLFCMTIAAGLIMSFYDAIQTKKLCLIERKLNIKQRINKKQVKQLLLECFPLCVYMLLFAAITTIPRIFLEKMKGTELLGVYASIFAPALLIQAGAGYLYTPLLSIFAEYQKRQDKKAFKNLFLKVSAGILGVSVGILFLGKVIGSFVLRLMIGKQIIGYEYLLNGILLCTIFTAFASFLCALVTVRRKFKILMIGTVSASVLCIILSPICISIYGLAGTSYALIISMTLLILLTYFFELKNLEIIENKSKEK